MQPLDFVDALKLIPNDYDATKSHYAYKGYNIKNFPMKQGYISLFEHCQTAQEIYKLIKHNYTSFWWTDDVFSHIKNILTGKRIDQIIILFVPGITCWSNVYNIRTFLPESEEKSGDIFRIAVLLNSLELLQKIIEIAGPDATHKQLNYGAYGELSKLALACKNAEIEMIRHLMIFYKTNIQTSMLHYYLYNGKILDKKIVELLANKDNIMQHDDRFRIASLFGIDFADGLCRKLRESKPIIETAQKDSEITKKDSVDAHDVVNKDPIVSHTKSILPDLVDANDNVVGKDPAALAIAAFGNDDVLPKDKLTKTFMKPGTVMMLTDIHNKRFVVKFIDGVYIEIPLNKSDNDKIRFHQLTMNGKIRLVRFDGFYVKDKWFEFN